LPQRLNPSPARVGALMALASMTSVQLGLAVAVGLIARIGADGASWLRLVWAGALFLVIVRPRPSAFTKSSFAACVLLGIATAGITVLFMFALSHLPLGTASALEFLGPLGVAVVTARARLLWPVLAGAGVLLLTRPWEGDVDPVGIGFALAAAVCWAAYIVLTQRVGDEVAGITGLSVSMPVAALVATCVTGPSIVGKMTPDLLLIGLGVAILLPVFPFILELLALRRLTTGAFGTLMALEPAIALVIGLLLLHQVPHPLAIVGVCLVVAAGVGAARTGARPPLISTETR
jgi:inner membrane transporter RhtA